MYGSAMPRDTDGTKQDGVKSAQRALAILELLMNRERALTSGEIARVLAYPRSSLHGLLRTLADRGWIEFDGATHAYRLGIRTWEAGNVYMRAVTIAEQARPYMEHVRDAMNETVQLALLDGRYNIYIAKVDGTQHLTLDSAVGRRLEAHATALGKALLAGLAADELDRRLGTQPLERFTPSTVSDQEALRTELALIRKRGYALDNEEYTRGLRCTAMPIRDHMGAYVAALSISIPTVRFTAERQRQALNLLREATTALSQARGYCSDGGSAAISEVAV